LPVTATARAGDPQAHAAKEGPRPEISVTPHVPKIATRRVTISFKAPFALRHGWRWDVVLSALSESAATRCAANEEVFARTQTRAGAMVRVTLTPRQSIAAASDPGLSEWCPAAVELTVTADSFNQASRWSETIQFRFVQ
jgi:hypothetical protein